MSENVTIVSLKFCAIVGRSREVAPPAPREPVHAWTTTDHGPWPTFVRPNVRILLSMASKLLLAVTLACLVAVVRGYGSGAPPEACVDMIPQHPVPPQTTPPPYTITTSTKVVKAGTPMEVVITGKTPSDTMRGLLLQARLGNEPVGSFKIPSAASDFAQLLNCGTPDLLDFSLEREIRHRRSRRLMSNVFGGSRPIDSNVKFRPKRFTQGRESLYGDSRNRPHVSIAINENLASGEVNFRRPQKAVGES
ncbi:Putative defense protein Hdd11-like [Eumeta japonica]|uniref:Defense protein Hdd11-like n=1 Tax=Eumeta variegata TaxID=151549 RepID=A0A4C1VHU8_EUMVA|nr:Putative defense protein Hdd11-like [Eumeta japonica]